MMLLTFATDAIRKRFRRAILTLTQPPSRHNVPTEYYRFPWF
jgi:hypothetical protein